MSETIEDETDTLEALARLPTQANPIASPAGDRIALYYDVTGRNELHVLDPETGDLDRWSDGDVPRDARWFVRWSPDGERVYFHKDDAGNEQHDIHAIDATGEARPVVEMDGQSTIFDVAEEFLLFGSSRDGQMNLYRYGFETDEVAKLTDYERAVRGAILSPTGEHIAYSTNETGDFDNLDVYLAHPDGSDPRNLELGEIGAEATPAGWGPEGRRLLVADNTPDLGRIGLYDLDREDVEWFGDPAYDESPVAVLPDAGADGGTALLATRDRAAATMPVLYDVDTGEETEFDLPEGVASFGAGPWGIRLADGRLLLQHTTPTRRPELLAYDLDTHDYEVLLEAEYGPFDPDDFADAEYVTFRSDGVPETPAAAVDHEPSEGLQIEGLLYEPGSRPAPLVVNPHGGPRGRDTKRFSIYTQVLALQGYAVLQVNYRGSTGRGREFVERLIDDWGGAEQGDVATGVEHVLSEYGWLDDQRVAVFGGSYGGYSAYWQLVQYPELYDAGVAWIGLTDLEGMYEETMPHYRTELMEKYLGTPEDDPDLYEERSPITHVANVQAPLLVIHGVNDRRVPISQARRFRDALQERGLEEGPDGDFEYVELGEEGHASSDQAQQLRMFEQLVDFLDRRL